MHQKIFAILLVPILLSGCLGQDDNDIEFNGIEYREPPRHLILLDDQNGEEFTLSDLEGKVVVVAFIYTSCPDICLAISANMAYAQDSLGEKVMMSFSSRSLLILQEIQWNIYPIGLNLEDTIGPI